MKNVSKELFTRKIKKNRRSREKNKRLGLQDILITGTNHRKFKLFKAGMFIGLFCFQFVVKNQKLLWDSDKTNRFHVAMGLFSNRSQKTSKCGKNIGDTVT